MTLFGRERPPHSIKINVSYREMHASAVDSNLTQWMFILNGNFSNKIDQFLMLFILQEGQRAGVKYSCVICRGNITWMKRTLLLLLIIPLNSHAKGAHKLSKTVTSIMGIDAEDRDKDRLALNFETDVYYYQATDYAAPMLTYSTHGWDLGVSSQNVLMSGGGGSQNFQNDTYLNIAKTFKYGQFHKRLDWLSTTVGTQNGLVIPLSDGVEPGKINHNILHQFYFIDTDITLIKNRLSVHVGPYYVNQALSTTTSYFGYETVFRRC